MKVISILEVILGLTVAASLILQASNKNWVAIIFGVVVLLQCAVVIFVAEGGLDDSVVLE